MPTRLLILILLLPGSLAAAPEVAVSIRPVHSLVSALMRDIATPQLVMNADSDPHHFSLRPSQRRQIAHADLVVWIGPDLEAGLARAIEQSRGRSLALLDTRPPRLHATRGRQHHHGEPVDAHIWLSPENAVHIAGIVADALISIDEPNRERYLANRDRLVRDIRALEDQVAQMLPPGGRYIAHHDAYQYFETRFGLVSAGFVRDSEDADVSSRRLTRLKRLLESGDTGCVVYDSEPRPAIIEALIGADGTRDAQVPVLGAEFEPGERLWFELMLKMAGRFHQCLQ